MANNDADIQLPSMVRKPKMVWPGLDSMGLHHKSIAGDGNCLFASLADQLYGNPSQHQEIRTTIVEHMRENRPLYEAFVNTDDVVQRRATRTRSKAANKLLEDDAFETYLTLMSNIGTYGGQPELQAFVRAYDQDVSVHLPPETKWETLVLPYTNDLREPNKQSASALHICYGGDEVHHAHYDSSEKTEKPKRSDMPVREKVLTQRPKSQVRSTEVQAVDSPTAEINARAIRNNKADPTKDMMHEMVTKGGKDLKSSLDVLNHRERSPSATSSQYSTSSKRSFEDDDAPVRSAKRTDRKRSLHTRSGLKVAGLSRTLSQSRISPLNSSGPPTPSSSQDSDSSDQAEHLATGSASFPPAAVGDTVGEPVSQSHSQISPPSKAVPRQRGLAVTKSKVPNGTLESGINNERPPSAVRT